MKPLEQPEGGLRVTKKHRTRLELIANAVALFRLQGIRGTRTSEIARRGSVSPGTLFNYFPTKHALVEAWLRGELEQAVVDAVETHGERGLRPLVRQICRALAENVLESPSLRAEGWGMLGRGRSPAFRVGSRTEIARIVRTEQGRERVRADHAPEVLAEMLMDGFEGALIAALTRRSGGDLRGEMDPGRENAERAGEAPEKLSGPDARAESKQLEARMDLILDGLRKRNERVLVPAAASRPR